MLLRRVCFAFVMFAFGSAVRPASGQIVNSEWNASNGNWNVTGNWFPNAVPDNGGGFTYNVQIGNRPIAVSATVTFVPASGTSDTVSSLTVSNDADLLTNGNQLNVFGQTTIDGAGSTIRVDPHASPGTPSLQAIDLDLNNGGGLSMMGGVASVSGTFENNSSVIGGWGQIDVGDFDLLAEQAFENSGLIQVAGNTAGPRTLTIHANGQDTIDLDGDSETGIVQVSNSPADTNADTLSLTIDGPLTDAFNSTLQIGQRDTVTFTHPLSLSGATVQMAGGNNLATLNGAGDITSATNTAITVASGSARIENDVTFTGTANTITVMNNSSLDFEGDVTLPDASAVSLTSSSQLIVGGSMAVSEAAGDFNWDGTGTATTTVKGTGQLTLTVNRVDTTDDVYGGTLNLDDDGGVSINNVANVWTMDGTLHKRNAGNSTVGGDAVNVTGTVMVDTGGLSMPKTTLSPGANVTVNGTMTLGAASVLAGPTSITGSGTLRMAGTSTVAANTTIGTSSFDWDGGGSGTLQTINDGIVLTVNSTTWDADDAGDMDDPINIGGSGGQMLVNNVASWTMNRTLTANTSGLGITTIGGSSRLIMSGPLAILNANGQVAVNAPITFGASSSANIAAPGFIRMNGGDGITMFNRIEGATINGPGPLVAINNKELRGFGTINSQVSFQNTSALRADDGTLTIGGAITAAANIGTADTDGILNVVNAWNSSVATNVVLFGGELQGGAITVGNTNGIKGRGLVSARVVNNTRLEADSAGNTLAFQTAANDNDWDGGANTGVLAVSNGATLEVRDNATFTYGGTVIATDGSLVYSKGFGFNFFSTSTVNLSESTLQADETTTLGGAINVGAGADSTINVQVNRFLDIKSTSVVTLNGNLRLASNNGHIEAGATFSGAGAVIVPDGSHLVPEANANINALLVNEGAIRPSNFDGVGRVDLRDYQQTDSGELYVELTGTLLNQFDRLVISGAAQLDGYLNIDIDGGFVPALGQSFNIISATGGVLGQFDHADVSGMPAGLTFHINYLPTAVQLQVVSTPMLSADFDDDGDVDSTDLAIWRAAFDLNQLGDADGDNDSDGADFLIWQRQQGSAPAVAATKAVPEPTATVMAVALLSLIPICRVKRRCFESDCAN
jgi:hypothetical protein